MLPKLENNYQSSEFDCSNFDLSELLCQLRFKFTSYKSKRLSLIQNWELSDIKPCSIFAVCQSLLKIGTLLHKMSFVFKKELLALFEKSSFEGSFNHLITFKMKLALGSILKEVRRTFALFEVIHYVRRQDFVLFQSSIIHLSFVDILPLQLTFVPVEKMKLTAYLRRNISLLSFSK